ncbi:MAG: dTMP kinase [Dehalococcoidia bacterium]
MSDSIEPSTRGPFVTLEGGEGAGKSLQAGALTRRLEGAGVTVARTREPGGTPLGERLREVLLDLARTNTDLTPLTEALLFIAARAELVARVIAPALEGGDAVVCDRFGDSTLAYQAYGRGVDIDLIERLNVAATRGLRPQLTVLLDLPVEDGLARTGAEGRADRFGREERAFHERVRQGYQTLANREPDRWLVIDALQPPDAVTDAIWARVEPLLAKAARHS